MTNAIIIFIAIASLTQKLALLTAIYVLLDNTIKTRKYGILYSKFSILTYENMTLCLHKITEISKMNIQEYILFNPPHNLKFDKEV